MVVGGLIADLVMSIFLLPTLYVWFAGPNDVLPKPEGDFEDRLSSGRDGLEDALKADCARNSAREEALIRFLASIDHRVRGVSLEAT